MNKFICRRNTGKINAAIDYFVRELKSMSLDDEITINTVYNTRKEILDIYAGYKKIEVHVHVTSFMLLNNMSKMNQFTHYVYDIIKNDFIAYFEEIENDKKEESEIDEKWEFVELGGM